MCKGSCRRTPTEGLAECRRWQPVLLVRCPDGQAVLPHPVKQPSKMMQSASQSPLSACGGLSPLCTRGAVASRHGGEPPLPNCAAALENRIGLGLHPGPYRVMVYHTRSSGANNASPPETGTGAASLRLPGAGAQYGSGGSPLAGQQFFDLPGFGFPAADQKFAVHHQGRGGHNSQFDDLYQIFHLLHISFHPQVAQGFLGVFISPVAFVAAGADHFDFHLYCFSSFQGQNTGARAFAAAKAGPVPGQASRAPALGRLHEEWQNSMAVPTRVQRHAGPVPVFAQVDTTSPGSVAWCGSTVWERRLAASRPRRGPSAWAVVLSLPRQTQPAFSAALGQDCRQGFFQAWPATPGAPRNGSAYSLGEFWVRRHSASFSVPFWRRCDSARLP